MDGKPGNHLVNPLTNLFPVSLWSGPCCVQKDVCALFPVKYIIYIKGAFNVSYDLKPEMKCHAPPSQFRTQSITGPWPPGAPPPVLSSLLLHPPPTCPANPSPGSCITLPLSFVNASSLCVFFNSTCCFVFLCLNFA